MSMSVRCDGCGLEYAGGRGLGGLFAQRRRTLADRGIWRCCARSSASTGAALRPSLEPTSAATTLTLGEFLAAGGFTEYFVTHFVLPLVACVWSCGFDGAARLPGPLPVPFLDHHGMLAVSGSPQWRTVVGGSRTLRRAGRAKDLTARAHRVHRSPSPGTPDGVRDPRRVDDQLHAVDRGRHRHPPRPGAGACSPTRPPDETRLLGAFEYSRERRPAAHRRLGAAAARRGPGVLELPDAPAATGARAPVRSATG